MIIFSRFCGGIGLGLTLSITPVYLVEVSQVELRGVLGVIPPLLTQAGVLYTYVAGKYLLIVHHNWMAAESVWICR